MKKPPCEVGVDEMAGLRHNLPMDEPATHLRYEVYTREAERFAERVASMVAESKPVKVYCGAGTVPRKGFLNLDIHPSAPEFQQSDPDSYFVFPFAQQRWPIPDNCVDYIFDEDFIEHVDQTMQFGFLAETLRVLKPGCWHRVNTPNIIAAMKYNSDFSKGYDGVFTGERRWQHTTVFSPHFLEECARLVGYREVVFTTKDNGVSPFAEPDFRPGAGREDHVGNIFADLLK